MITRRNLIERAIAYQHITLGWMLAAIGYGLSTGILHHSLTLVAFGAMSIVEYLLELFLMNRLKSQLDGDPTVAIAMERSVTKIGMALLLALFAFTIAGAGAKLLSGAGQEFSLVGFVLAFLTIPLMLRLRNAKLVLARTGDFGSLREAAAKSNFCMRVAAVVAIGLLAQLILRAHWIDALSAIALSLFLIRQTAGAWVGR